MKKKVIQTHHLSYEPEVTVRLYRGEHWSVTQLNRHKNISRGFIKAVKYWVLLNEDKGVEL